MTRSSPNFSGWGFDAGRGWSIQRLGQIVIVTGPRLKQVRFNMTSEPSNPNDSTTRSPLQRWIVVSLVLAGVFVVFGFVAAWLGYQPPRQDSNVNFLSDLGNYGSYLQGTVASLWALAAGFLVLAAFLGQKQQLALQREEFRQQQEQMDAQRKQFEAQERGIKRQNFESSFFQLLHLHNQNASQISGEERDVKPELMEGRKAFQYWYNILSAQVLEKVGLEQSGIMEKERELMAKVYFTFYESRQQHLGHYFRNLYHVFKFVDESKDIEEESKQRYASLVRAQLSTYELALLFYNGITHIPPERTNKFHGLIETYCLMEHLPYKYLFVPSHKHFYKPTAFQQPQPTNPI
jgi:hypothetical protein